MTISKKEELLKNLPITIVNSGFCQLPDSVTLCYDLSTDEKAMYLLLLKNLNDKLGYSFPSWEYMKLVLQRGDGKISTTLDSLEKKKLIVRKRSDGKRNKYYLRPLKEVPCIVLSEATFYFKKQAEALDIVVWSTICKVIRSKQYMSLKDNFTSESAKECLRLLQDMVQNEKGVKVPIKEIEVNKRALPF